MIQQIKAGGRIELVESHVQGAAVNLKLHNGGSLSVMLYLTQEEVLELQQKLGEILDAIHNG